MQITPFVFYILVLRLPLYFTKGILHKGLIMPHLDVLLQNEAIRLTLSQLVYYLSFKLN